MSRSVDCHHKTTEIDMQCKVKVEMWYQWFLDSMFFLCLFYHKHPQRFVMSQKNVHSSRQKFTNYRFFSLPDKGIIALSKLKAFAADKLNINSNIQFVSRSVENNVEKRDVTWIFSILSTLI